MEQQQHKLEYSGLAPSFSCYSSDNKTSKAIAKVINEENIAQHHNRDASDEFEFALPFNDQEHSVQDIDAQSWTVFNNEVSGSLGKVFLSERDDSSSYTSSEADETESPRARNKYKKSSSMGSGSKRWIFRYFLRRSNSEGTKEPIGDSPKHKRSSGEVSGERWKAQSPVHEQFYVQRRAENEMGKRRSYLPYRKDLVGLFANVNGMGKMLPF